MRAVLLAAGRGTRLQPLTGELPKCLVPVNGRPLIDYWLRNLAAIGVERFLVNLNYRAELVRGYLEAGPFASRIEFAHEDELLGTGGTLLANRAFVAAGTTLVAHADNLCQCDFGAFAAAHARRPAGTELTLMTFRAPDPRAAGIVETDAQGVVRGFHEKVAHPPRDLASAAVFVVEPGILGALETAGRKVIDLSRDVLPQLTGRMLAWHNAVYHRDIGSPDAWIGAQTEFPGDGRALEAGEFWARCCGEADSAQAVRIAGAIDAMWRGCGGRSLVLVPRFDPAQLDLLRQRHDPEGTLFLFWRSPPGFLAAQLFRDPGMRSISFCAA